MPSSLLRIETLTGQPVILNGAQLRVRSQVVQIRLPITSGGLIWNRPVAVLVQTPDGREQALPVPDVTRTAVLALAGLGLLSALLLMLVKRKTT